MSNKYSDLKILVIGDSCKDIFIYGNATRMAPEAPVPVFNPEYEISNGGMSLNVRNNIEAIGAKTEIITNPESILKKRFVDKRSNDILLRVDENDSVEEIKSDILNQIKNNYYNNFKFDAMIISDYCKGFLSEENIEFLSYYNHNVFLDTKKILGQWCKNVNFIKINSIEYQRSFKTIKKLNIYEKLIITKSNDGCEYMNIIYPVEKVEVMDVSGAGDTFMSGLVCEYVQSKNIINAILFAQECAKIVVQKKGVCTI